MADRPNYPVQQNPEYDPNIPVILNTDRVNADVTVNRVFTDIINNVHAIKLLADILESEVSNLTAINFGDYVTIEMLNPLLDSILSDLTAAILTRAPANTALSTVQWTNARAALLDRLNDTITSRAPASTALSIAQWTNARAALLDNLAAINTNASRLTQARAENLDRLTAALVTTINTINTNAARLTQVRAESIDALIARLTVARGNNLDNLNVNLLNSLGANNAPASAALTANMHAKLNAIFACIGSSTNGARVNVSVQRGLTQLPAMQQVTVAIATVNWSRSYFQALSAAPNNPLAPSSFVGIDSMATSNVVFASNAATNQAANWVIVSYQ